MEFYGPRGARLPNVEKLWNEDFAPRVYALSNAGLDGLIDVLHKSMILFGSMITEAEVSEDLLDLVDIHPVDPRWLNYERVNGVCRPYQYQDGRKVYVDSPNLSMVPFDSDIGDPRGNLMLAPAIFAIDTQLQIMRDIGIVIHNVGFPRQDISLKTESLMNEAKSLGFTTVEQMRQYVDEEIARVKSQFESTDVDSVFIHTDDAQYNLTKGANERGGVDVRALNEFIDLFVLNGLQQMGVFQNRTSGITETWGTVQYKIFTNLVESFRRASKRLIESNARIWARVHGFQALPKFEWKPIDWEAEETRWTVKLLEQTYWKIAEDMGWVSADEAARNVVGHDAEGERRERTGSDNDDDADAAYGVSRQVQRMQVERLLRKVKAG